MRRERDDTAGGLGAFVLRWRFPIIGLWLLLAGSLNLLIPQLDTVVEERSTPFIPNDAPSAQLMHEINPTFDEPPTSGIAFLVLGRDTGLTPADRTYYDAVVAQARADRDNVAVVQDLWSSPNTADAVVSTDGKAVYALIRLTSDSGTTHASSAIESLRDHTRTVPKPAGLDSYVTGVSPTIADEFDGIHKSLNIITAITVVLIAMLLLAVYRSFVIAVVPLTTMGLGLATARPIVAFLGLHGMPLSIFSMALLAALVLGGGTDYAIFLISRFHEERGTGVDRRTAFLRSYRRISTVIVASAAIVALTSATMSFTRIGMFKTIGLPCAVAIVVVALAALTLTPAILSIVSDLGMAEPKSRSATDLWRRVATRAVERPGRSLAAGMAVIALLALIAPTMVLTYDERATQPDDTESNRGYALAASHYHGNELLPTYLVIRSNHDMRNSQDFAAMDKITEAVTRVEDVVSVRSISRPRGEPIPQTAVGFQAGVVGDRLGAGIAQLAEAQPKLDQLTQGSAQFFDGVRRLADGTGLVVTGTDQAQAGSQQLVDGSRALDSGLGQLSAGVERLNTGATQVSDGAAQLNSGIATATTPLSEPLAQLQSLRAMVAANPNCGADPLCSAARGTLAFIDSSPIGDLPTLQDGASRLAAGSAALSAGAQQLLTEIQRAQSGSAQLLGGQLALNSGLQSLGAGVRRADDGSHRLAQATGPLQDGVDQLAGGMGSLLPGLQQATDYLTELKVNAGNATSGGFYLPASAMSDPAFQAAANLYLSKDGKTARIVVVDRGDPFSTDGMARSKAVTEAARQAALGTELGRSRIDAIGTSAAFADLRDMAAGDLMLIVVAACVLILFVLILLLRSAVVPIYILASVIISYVAALGLSTLVWQHILGVPLHWAVPSMSFIALTAVGADYNLLLMSRVREEFAQRPADGTKAAVVRAVTGTGGVITVAAVIFAITMFALLSSSITNIGQVGFTIGTGLLVDAMIVRTVMIPSLAVLLGWRNWWPRRVNDAADEHEREPLRR